MFRKYPRAAALVLVPTRELALQTAHVLKDLAKFLKLQIMTSTGGTDLKDDIIRLSKAVHVIVATPGRIHDLAQRRIANLSQCKHLVMDEVRWNRQKECFRVTWPLR